VRAGEVGVADELIGRITAEFGQPDLDTGWFTTPANPNPDSPDCLAGMDTRALWWGDLAVSLWPRDGSGRVGYAELWDWTLGAQPGVVNLPEGTSYTPAVSGLVTNEGVALGISQDAASALFSGGLDWTDGDPSAGGQFAYLQGRPPHYSGNYVGLFSDGQAITQISATRTFC